MGFLIFDVIKMGYRFCPILQDGWHSWVVSPESRTTMTWLLVCTTGWWKQDFTFYLGVGRNAFFEVDLMNSSGSG